MWLVQLSYFSRRKQNRVMLLTRHALMSRAVLRGRTPPLRSKGRQNAGQSPGGTSYCSSIWPLNEILCVERNSVINRNEEKRLRIPYSSLPMVLDSKRCDFAWPSSHFTKVLLSNRLYLTYVRFVFIPSVRRDLISTRKSHGWPHPVFLFF